MLFTQRNYRAQLLSKVSAKLNTRLIEEIKKLSPRLIEQFFGVSEA